mmetsp:Transcript_23656/g.51320  ORF Transcript_23656/g.51320 Transcript_23656/m.51320 type:complete len:317 (+) Transcript_23656:290-1240(+)
MHLEITQLALLIAHLLLFLLLDALSPLLCLARHDVLERPQQPLKVLTGEASELHVALCDDVAGPRAIVHQRHFPEVLPRVPSDDKRLHGTVSLHVSRHDHMARLYNVEGVPGLALPDDVLPVLALDGGEGVNHRITLLLRQVLQNRDGLKESEVLCPLQEFSQRSHEFIKALPVHRVALHLPHRRRRMLQRLVQQQRSLAKEVADGERERGCGTRTGCGGVVLLFLLQVFLGLEPHRALRDQEEVRPNLSRCLNVCAVLIHRGPQCFGNADTLIVSERREHGHPCEELEEIGALLLRRLVHGRTELLATELPHQPL